MTERDVAQLVYQHYTSMGYAVFRQVPAEPVEQGGRAVSRIIDVLAVLPGACNVAVEIKTRRQDFLSDVRNPDKQAPWRDVATWHYFVTAEGVARPDEIPVGSGLMAVETVTTASGPAQVLREVVPAPLGRNQEPGLTPWLSAHLLRSASDMLGLLNGWRSSGEDVVDLRAALERAQFAAAAAKAVADRANERAQAWQMLAAAQGHKVPCATCGAPIVPTRVSAGVPAGWRHAQPHLTTDCAGNQRGVRPREDTP